MTLEEFKKINKNHFDTFLGKESSKVKENEILQQYNWHVQKLKEDKQFNVANSLDSILDKETILKINSLVNFDLLNDNEVLILNLPSFESLTLLKLNSQAINQIQGSIQNLNQIDTIKLYELTTKIVMDAKPFQSQFHNIDGSLTIIISKAKICFKHSLHFKDSPLSSFFSTLGFN